MTFFFKFFPFRSSRSLSGVPPVATALPNFLIVAEEMEEVTFGYILIDMQYYFMVKYLKAWTRLC